MESVSIDGNDLYGALGLEAFASAEEIRVAYKDRVLVAHPDKVHCSHFPIDPAIRTHNRYEHTFTPTEVQHMRNGVGR